MADAALPVLPVRSAEFGLPATSIDALRGLFAQCERIGLALVYGSRAKGNYRPGSDIDIALDGPELSFSDLMRVETAIDDLMLPWNVDICLLSHIDNPDLLAHIARVGKPLWIRESSTC